MKTAIIAINITNNKRLLNPSGTPILLYWDGKQDIEELFKDYKPQDFPELRYNIPKLATQAPFTKNKAKDIIKELGY